MDEIGTVKKSQPASLRNKHKLEAVNLDLVSDISEGKSSQDDGLLTEIPGGNDYFSFGSTLLKLS
jgi:hypothetical protein